MNVQVTETQSGDGVRDDAGKITTKTSFEFTMPGLWKIAASLIVGTVIATSAALTIVWQQHAIMEKMNYVWTVMDMEDFEQKKFQSYDATHEVYYHNRPALNQRRGASIEAAK